MKVLVADKFEKAGLEGLAALGCEVVSQPGIGTEKLGPALAEVKPEVLVVRSTKVPAAVIGRGLPGLRLIVRAGAGVDTIDVGAATAQGVKVCNCPGMNAVAVAELAFGLLLCCDRRLPEQTAELRACRWNKKEFGRTGAGGAKGLKGMTLGVVGMGAIGQEVVIRARAFGMHVLVWSRGIIAQHVQALNAEFVGDDTPALLSLAGRADAVSVHLPLTDTTKKLFGTAFFDAMKPAAYFINTARGGVVDEAALREAIKAKGLRAGLDVYDSQPGEAEASWECETMKLPGVYGTHHSGASTDQAQNAVAAEVVRIVKVFKESGRAENAVNG